jgi:ankyrin repeat protein
MSTPDPVKQKFGLNLIKTLDPTGSYARSDPHDIITALFGKKADVKVRDKKGNTALMFACKRGLTEIALDLIKRGSDITAKNEVGETPESLCSELPNVRDTIQIMKIMDHIQNNPRYGDPDYELIDDTTSSTELLFLTCKFDLAGDAISLIEMEIVDVNARDRFNNTLLMIASRKGLVNNLFVDIAYMLLERGADINAVRADNKKTALHYACSFPNKEMIRLLVEKGANIDAPDIYGATPKSMTKNPEILAILTSKKTAEGGRRKQKSRKAKHKKGKKKTRRT